MDVSVALSGLSRFPILAASHTRSLLKALGLRIQGRADKELLGLHDSDLDMVFRVLSQ